MNQLYESLRPGWALTALLCLATALLSLAALASLLANDAAGKGDHTQAGVFALLAAVGVALSAMQAADGTRGYFRHRHGTRSNTGEA